MLFRSSLRGSFWGSGRLRRLYLQAQGWAHIALLRGQQRGRGRHTIVFRSSLRDSFWGSGRLRRFYLQAQGWAHFALLRGQQRGRGHHNIVCRSSLRGSCWGSGKPRRFYLQAQGWAHLALLRGQRRSRGHHTIVFRSALRGSFWGSGRLRRFYMQAQGWAPPFRYHQGSTKGPWPPYHRVSQLLAGSFWGSGRPRRFYLQAQGWAHLALLRGPKRGRGHHTMVFRSSLRSSFWGGLAGPVGFICRNMGGPISLSSGVNKGVVATTLLCFAAPCGALFGVRSIFRSISISRPIFISRSIYRSVSRSTPDPYPDLCPAPCRSHTKTTPQPHTTIPQLCQNHTQSEPHQNHTTTIPQPCPNHIA